MNSITQRVLRVGTRGSLLARTQTSHVISALTAAHADLKTVEVVIRTSGDRDRRDVRGAFTREIEQALLSDAIDLAVHSLKDLPVEPTANLEVAATPAREDPRDVLITNGPDIQSLPQDARIGSGSARRTMQVRGLRRDVAFVPIVGNVDTRLAKLADGHYDGIVMAAAALTRLGHADALRSGRLALAERACRLFLFSLDEVVPAPGQGALAVQTRSGDAEVRDLVRAVHDEETWAAVRAERAVLSAIGGGCNTPVGAYATVDGPLCHLCAIMASASGETCVRAGASGSVLHPDELGRDVARALLEAARRAEAARA